MSRTRRILSNCILFVLCLVFFAWTFALLGCGARGVSVDPNTNAFGVELDNGVMVDVDLTADGSELNFIAVGVPEGMVPPVAGNYVIVSGVESDVDGAPINVLRIVRIR